MRDRLFLSYDLLDETGSIFVQINDENVHRVRCLMDEIFGSENFVSQITYRTKNMTFGAKYLETIADFLLWYAKDKSQLKYRPLFRKIQVEGDTHWNPMEFEDGRREPMTLEQVNNHSLLPPNVRNICQLGSLYPAGVNRSGLFTVRFRGKQYSPPSGKSWKTNEAGLRRVIEADRLEPYLGGTTIRYVLKVNDHPVSTVSSLWAETPPPSGKRYAVETSDRVVERCILMTTDPGDLVFDPTCGSGTTAYCAEKWGRRWITCDTSRVALTLACQRLMTAKFDYYELANPERGPAGSFVYESFPHIMMETIAHNTEIDDIAAKYQPQIAAALKELNQTLSKTWEEWEVPRESDIKWAEKTKKAHQQFWAIKLKKRQEIDATPRRSCYMTAP
jgi:adenine-specific DNA-methyltransferase